MAFGELKTIITSGEGEMLEMKDYEWVTSRRR